MYTFNESSMFSLSYFKCNESQMGNESLMSNIVCYRISKEIFPFLNVALRERQHFLGFFPLECHRLIPQVLVNSRNWGLQANAH